MKDLDAIYSRINILIRLERDLTVGRPEYADKPMTALEAAALIGALAERQHLESTVTSMRHQKLLDKAEQRKLFEAAAKQVEKELTAALAEEY